MNKSYYTLGKAHQ